ncbi:hypothetical protein Scep_011571 [Stephania cephalantha]|uniref:Trichome birefringence-like N-terminal domain-containing protein n=1 Tax=Stephania cephalantha TaxID=152367 RepID=A0AAP0JDM0_9MAGN
MEATSATLLKHRNWSLLVLSSFLFCFFLMLYIDNNRRPNLSALGGLWIAPITVMSEALATGTDITSTTTISKAIVATNSSNTSSTATSEATEKMEIVQTREKCDIYNGRWVYDQKAHPMYETSRCPFLSNQVTCRKNGRPDHDYERWRWEAMNCEIPRFNGTDMLERLRGKRVIIVGDSLNRNMWESLACILYSSVPSGRAEVDASNGDYKIFKAKDFDCSVEFYWNPFLVQLDKHERILSLDKLHVSARRWKGAKIMVFNTGHWWTHGGKTRVWDFMQHGGKMMDDLPLERAFQIAMKTWADWIDRNVDPAETTVFFRSISPEHKGKQWCYNQTHPMKGESYKDSFPRSIVEIAEKTIRDMKAPVKYLNITKLSQYRIDAHSTIYTTKAGKLLTEKQRRQPELYADCSHWCLPGLPDTWNALMYASFILEGSSDVS